MTKIDEVAKLARVAPSSVSRVLNDHPDVSDEMKARVLRAAEQLGYQPNFLAQSLRRASPTLLGLLSVTSLSRCSPASSRVRSRN